MKRLRTVFMGTPEFAVPCLARLAEISEVVGIVTQPDKKRGRGQKLTPPPVKVFAQENNLRVIQPVKVKAPEVVEVAGDVPDPLAILMGEGIEEDVAKQIVVIFTESDSLRQAYNKLRSVFGNTAGRDYYQQVKDIAGRQ